MPKKKLISRPKNLSINLNEKEAEVLQNHCSAEGYSISGYIRALIRVHLGLDDFGRILFFRKKSCPKKKKNTEQ